MLEASDSHTLQVPCKHITYLIGFEKMLRQGDKIFVPVIPLVSATFLSGVTHRVGQLTNMDIVFL